MSFRNPVRLATYAAVFALAAVALLLPYNCPTALASHTPPPTSVTIAGSLQSELGCGGDWDPGCAATHLTYDANDGVRQGTFNGPAGNWEHKAPPHHSR